jgi:hypothetical protein
MVYFVLDIKTRCLSRRGSGEAFGREQAQQNRAFILKTLNTCSYPIIGGRIERGWEPGSVKELNCQS